MLTNPPLSSDLFILGRVGLWAMENDQEALDAMLDVIERAIEARAVYFATGRSHSVYGRGSIMAAALGSINDLPGEPSLRDPTWVAMLRFALDALDWLSNKEMLKETAA